MKKIEALFLGIVIAMLCTPALSIDVSQSFRGYGSWEIRDINSYYRGIGDMSFASILTKSDNNFLSRQGIEFEGSHGNVKLKGAMSELGYDMRINNADNFSLRIDQSASTSSSVAALDLSQISTYNVGINGVVRNGSISESISKGWDRGKPIQLSAVQGKGTVFEINTSARYAEYLTSSLVNNTGINEDATQEVSL